MSCILITGSHGLVGTAMKSLLTSAGHNVRSLDLRAPQGDGGGDVLDLRAVETAATECDGILHFAAVSRVIWGEHDPALCRATGACEVVGGLAVSRREAAGATVTGEVMSTLREAGLIARSDAR